MVTVHYGQNAPTYDPLMNWMDSQVISCWPLTCYLPPCLIFYVFFFLLKGLVFYKHLNPFSFADPIFLSGECQPMLFF